MALHSLLAELRSADWAVAAAQELAAAEPELGSLLSAALLGAESACEAVTAALWQRAEDGVGWTAPCFRECFVLACAASATALLASSPKAALRALDCAFIMGAPHDVLAPFVAAVEPAVPRCVPLLVDDELSFLSPTQAGPPRTWAQLPQLESSELSRFRREFFDADRPVVLKGVALDWPACSKWRSLRWWVGEHGHRHIPLEVGSHAAQTWHEEVRSVEAFVAALRAGDEIVYCAQHTLFEHLPSLQADFCAPAQVSRKVTRVNCWFGSAGTTTPLHYDSYDGLLAQAVGYKLIVLFAASDGPLLYRSSAPWAAQRRWPTLESEPAAPSSGARGSISLVDVEAPDLERFPLFAQARGMSAVLGPGDAVFIPAGCWHFVKSLSVSVSVSFVL